MQVKPECRRGGGATVVDTQQEADLPAQYHLIRSHDLLYVRMFGSDTAENVIRRLERFFQDGPPAKYSKELIDTRELQFEEVGYRDFFTLSNRRARYAVGDKPVHCVVVVADENMYALARQYKSAAEVHPGVSVGIFEDMRAALDALAIAAGLEALLADPLTEEIHLQSPAEDRRSL
jgi:hypothetical protein